jgi:AcrR family transcriptional regulator
MDHAVQNNYPGAIMDATESLTIKGAATRQRIVVAAADLVLERGARGTSLDDIRAATATSKSQLFHYFPAGKGELIEQIAALQGERVLDAQRPHLERLDSWSEWEAWRAAVVDHYSSQRHLRCPVGALTAELIASEPERAALLTAFMDRWRGFLTAGVRRMVDGGLLSPGTDPERLALSVFAALQGGLALMAMSDSIEPLCAALDGALDALRAHASPPGPGVSGALRAGARRRHAFPDGLQPGQH